MLEAIKSAPFFTHAQVNCALHSRRCLNPEQVGGEMYESDKIYGYTTNS